jgi:N-methylhydantoinase A/oxoprolinase/acetone carboxylase beta subunit
MRIGLGIDTGGTYTDAVLYDFDENQVLSTAKSITRKEDLTIGINGAIDRLTPALLREVSLVSLSTTLATNACVEGKGSRAKLILIGVDRRVVQRYGNEYGLADASDIVILPGGHDQQGELAMEPDWTLLQSAVMASRSRTDVYAVVECWGIRNADIEKRAKALIEQWTGLPVVCGYELTNEINSLKRAASAYLNARLIPIINDFLNAVRSSLDQKGIHVPLVIVRGDGSLMSEEFAREKPVETLLCGPAASVSGGISLTGVRDCIIIDMGGTTSDIAIARNGIPRLAMDGASIGKWRTGIRSIMIHTIGLGGDSLIHRDRQGTLQLGPVRAAPLSWAASNWPGILGTIQRIHTEGRRHSLSLCEFFYSVRDISDDPFYSMEERRISSALCNGPLSLTELAEAAESSIYELKTARLEHLGVIMRCGLTPTDIMHLTGAFTGWQKDAAFYGASIMANQLNVPLEEFIDVVNEKVKERLYYNIVQMLLDEQAPSLMKDGVSRQLDYLVTSSFRNRKQDDGRTGMPRARSVYPGETRNTEDTVNANAYREHRYLDVPFTTDATLVGIGAPIHIYLPDVAKALGTGYVVPQNAGVANAIGAITGNVVAEEQILIKPVYSPGGITGYLAFSTAEKATFAKRADAVEWARTKASEMVAVSARARGAAVFEQSVTVLHDQLDISGMRERGAHHIVEETFVPDAGHSAATVETVPPDDEQEQEQERKQLLLETVVTARAIGKITSRT